MLLGTALTSSAPAFAAPTPTPAPQSITTIAGDHVAGSGGNGGIAVKAQLDAPTGVAEDLTGTLYIGDSLNNEVRKVVKPTTPGQDIISIFAGNGARGFAGDGGRATSAELNTPSGVAVNSSGDVFIADTGNNRIREVLPSGVITTFAGNGTCSFTNLGNGGQAKAASLCAPTGVAVDSGGHVYISDTGHSEVRMVTASGVINSYAGTGVPGYSGDGGKATKAQLLGPTGLAVDSSTDLFIADTANSRIREVAANGNINTFAGNGKFGYSGDGGSATKAEVNAPTGVAVDSSGNVYISDTLNNRIRKVSGGTITTYAGNGTAGYTGDGGPATSAEIHTPTGSMAMDGTALYFADTSNQVVRGVFTGPPPVLPETNLLILLPIGAGALLLGGSLLVFRRRRRVTAAV